MRAFFFFLFSFSFLGSGEAEDGRCRLREENGKVAGRAKNSFAA